MSSPPGRDRVLIGVDGGASGVRAHRVLVLEDGRLVLGRRSFEQEHGIAPGFEPLALEQQAAELRAPRMGPEERAAGERWIATAASCIGAVLEPREGPATVGVALPGVKTADGRGTIVVRNGPRIPAYLDRLEARLARAGLELDPIGRLFGDGHCCGLGEELAAEGLFSDVRDAYYLGSGTGVAEALKLDGELLSLEQVEGFPRAWQLEDERGASLEPSVSVAAVNRRWLEASERPQPLRPSAWPEDHVGSDVLAVAALTNLGTATARLVHRRLVAACGRGRPLERVVLGQRLGQLWTDERAAPFLVVTAERELARLLTLCTDSSLAAPYLTGGGGPLGRARPGLLVPSELRAAPAPGAAAAALELGRG